MAVVNRDLGVQSRELIARFAGSRYFAQVLPLSGDRAAQATLDASDAILVLEIGDDFSRALAADHTAQVQILLDGRRSNAAQIAEGYAEQIVGRNIQSGSHYGDPPAASDEHSGLACMVQSKPHEPMEHRARAHRRADHAPWHGRDRTIRRARARTRHVRAASGLAAAAHRDPHRQGHSRLRHRHRRGEHDPGDRGVRPRRAVYRQRSAALCRHGCLSRRRHRRRAISRPSSRRSSRRSWAPSPSSRRRCSSRASSRRWRICHTGCSR